MKKILIIAALFLGIATAASAQSKAIGARLVGFGTYGMEASYEHFAGTSDNFFEFEAGVDLTGDNAGFKVSAGFNWVFAEPDWTTKGTWQWYAGPGVTTGVISYEVNTDDWKTKGMFGVFGQVGLEYTFPFHLQLSADVRPTFAICNGEFYGDYFVDALVPTISVRYHF